MFRTFEAGLPFTECFAGGENSCPLVSCCRLKCALVTAVEATAEDMQMQVHVEGYPPPFDAIEAKGLTVDGLMCIPPADENPGPHFALLAKLARDHGLDQLSMGMSGDYETAVRIGATHVRIGSALFGAR